MSKYTREEVIEMVKRGESLAGKDISGIETLFVISLRDYEFMFPFICHQCGACCQRTYQIEEGEPRLQIIADFLGASFGELKQLYSEAYQSQSTCPFLKKDSTCKIHPVKLDICKSYMGEGFDRCIGWPEFQRIYDSFFANAKYDLASREFLERFNWEKCPFREVPMMEWPNLWKIFLSANPSPKMIQGFIELNCIPEIIWEKGQTR